MLRDWRNAVIRREGDERVLKADPRVDEIEQRGDDLSTAA